MVYFAITFQELSNLLKIKTLAERFNYTTDITFNKKSSWTMKSNSSKVTHKAWMFCPQYLQAFKANCLQYAGCLSL